MVPVIFCQLLAGNLQMKNYCTPQKGWTRHSFLAWRSWVAFQALPNLLVYLPHFLSPFQVQHLYSVWKVLEKVSRLLILSLWLSLHSRDDELQHSRRGSLRGVTNINDARIKFMKWVTGLLLPTCVSKTEREPARIWRRGGCGGVTEH